jgi:catechol 2,3-dioxygenase-like lactoylglutathione lyase family enzyme
MIGDAGPFAVTGFDHIVLNVRDVELSAAWYARVLGMVRNDFEPGQGKATRVSMAFGSQKINLRPADADAVDWFTAARPVAGSDDLCFLTTAEPAQVVAHLAACGVAVEQGPVPKQGARGTLRSVYCRDPDGSLIEIASYAT